MSDEFPPGGEQEDDVALARMVAKKKESVEVQRTALEIETEYVRLETKKKQQRIKGEVRATNTKCINWLRGKEGWNPVAYGGDSRVQIFEQTLEDGAYLVKSRGPVKHWDAWTFAQKNMDTNHVSRVSWDTDIADIKKVETIDRAEELNQVPPHIGINTMPGKIDVIWYKVAVPTVASALGIWPRDFCCWQYWALKGDGSILITSSSTFHESRAAAEEGCVRGETMCAMYITPLEPSVGAIDLEEPTIYVTMVAYVKPNGLIPSSVISWYRHRMGERIEFFSKVYRKACHFPDKE